VYEVKSNGPIPKSGPDPSRTGSPPSEEGSLLVALLRAARKRWKLVLLLVALVTAVALGLTLAQSKVYSASASLLFRDPALDDALFGPGVVQGPVDPTREAQTNLRLVSLDVVADRAGQRLGLTGDAVQAKVEVSAEGESDVISITATDSDPEAAAELANTFAQEYIAFRRSADRAKIRNAQELVRRELAKLEQTATRGEQLKTLEAREDQLAILRSLQTGNAELVQRAEPPTSPSSPKPVLNLSLGLLLGLCLGLAAAWLREQRDPRITAPEEVESIWDQPLLAMVPESEELSRRDSRSGIAFPEGLAGEAIVILRANLRYFRVSGEIRSVAVTSAGPGEGKSTVATFLAAAAARSGVTTLLIEADLRKPTLGLRGLREDVGLSGVLAGQVTFDEAIQKVPITRNNEAISEDHPTLDVLAAGPHPPNPSEMIDSTPMRDMIRAAEAAYDLVVIDTPPTSVVADAIPILSNVSGVIVITRVGFTTRDATSGLRHQLGNLSVRVLGLVVNGVRTKRAGYYGHYGLSAYSASSSKEADLAEVRN
jgi:polysaccharide biosynthesis transport protein